MRTFKLTPKIVSLAAAAAIACTCTIWLTNRAQAQTKRTGFLAYGMIGIASGQTLRVSTVSVNVGHDVPVELLFLDSQGNVLAHSADKLLPGHAIFLDYRFPGTSSGNRVQVRALVRWTTDLGTDGYVIPAVEVIDDGTGRTVVSEPDPAG
jgi:hypothetical protein